MAAINTIKGRLIIQLALLGALLLASVLSGQHALSTGNDSLRIAYEDRAVPLGRFLAIREAYDRIVDASRGVRDHVTAPQAAAEAIEAGLVSVGQHLNAYRARAVSPEEQGLATALQRQVEQNGITVADVLRRLRASDLAGYSAAHLTLNQMMAPTVAALGTLTALQLRETRAEFERAQEAAARSRWILIACLAAAGVAILFGVHTVWARVSRPLDRTTALMGRLASGDLTATVEGADRRDEIGAMIRAVQIFKDAMIAKQAADAAADAENATKSRRAALLDAVTRRFEADISALTGSLTGAASDMETTAHAMTRVAGQATAQAATVAGAAAETSNNVQTVASATEEMAASVQEIVEQVTRSAQIADTAVAGATRTGATVRRLATTAERIAAFTDVIAGIARQTNLLALNATIEAARAGEAGRGFAVVAGEVKALAEQTAKATGEIGERIGEIQTATDEAIGDIDAIGRIVAEMSRYATAVAAAMDEQGAATREITRNVQEAARGTGQVTHNIAGVRQGADQTGQAAAGVLNAAQTLSLHADSLTRAVGAFLSSVKAA